MSSTTPKREIRISTDDDQNVTFDFWIDGEKVDFFGLEGEDLNQFMQIISVVAEYFVSKVEGKIHLN